MYRRPACHRPRRLKLAIWPSVVTALALAAGPSACSWLEDSALQAVKSDGELVVLTYESPVTYYDSPEGPAGFEYDLAKAFAESLGVTLRVVVAERLTDVIPRLRTGEAHFAAAALADTEARRAQVRFTEPYRETEQQVVYRLGEQRPTSIAVLVGRDIEVGAGTSYAERLRELARELPALKWQESPDKSTDELLQFVWEGLLEITVAHADIVDVNRQYFPELQVAFALKKSEKLAWAFRKGPDDSLFAVAQQFLAGYRDTGELANLVERYYGPARRSNFINLTVYQLRIQNRLPQYQSMFEQAAQNNGLDWRMLAAVGYQESYWNPSAVSPTGVRGIMMLTADTAEQLGVTELLDAAQNIRGGARYLRYLIGRIPQDVMEPDRTWMALAAYNVGINHLEDARILTRQQGGDPNKWNDVKDRLPLLAKREYFSKARFGYARGWEPVIFVNRVRTYYDVLVKLDEEERAKLKSEALKLKAPAI